ncbi:hypothetical protein [Streptomyces sp. NPDC007083]|uniref:hypothetical protein n=1 Tax=Streptomyces sp. NPDC007083 TaxID=3156913 RepID=UPI0033DBD348
MSLPSDHLSQVAESIKASGVNLLINRFQNPRYAHISHLYVPKEMRGAQVGKNALRTLCKVADEDRYILGISPTKEFGADWDRFDALCKSFGFQRRTKDWPSTDFVPRLIRYPRHGHPDIPPSGTRWQWDHDMQQWVWRSYPELCVEMRGDGSPRYMGWDPSAWSGKGEWYELPEFQRTDWVFQYLPRGFGWGPRALTRDQFTKALREDHENGFVQYSWRLEDRKGHPYWVCFMVGITAGRVLRIYEYVYSSDEAEAHDSSSGGTEDASQDVELWSESRSARTVHRRRVL